MPEDLFSAQYDVTKKSKLKRFYESYKILIFSILLILIVSFSIFSFYEDSKKKKRILLSENYFQAKIYLQNKNKEKAKKILENIIFSNDSTYSLLSFFLILDQNLIIDHNQLSDLFDHILTNNKLEKEIKNLLIYKKALLDANYIDESELLEKIKPLLNDDNLWRPHALLLMGDYFLSKKEALKAKDFYIQILSVKNLNKDFYNEAKLKITLIDNE